MTLAMYCTSHRYDFVHSCTLFSSFSNKKSLFFICHWLAMSNGLYNPFIYALFSVRPFCSLSQTHCWNWLEYKVFHPMTYHLFGFLKGVSSFTIKILLTFLNYSKNWNKWLQKWVFKAMRDARITIVKINQFCIKTIALSICTWFLKNRVWIFFQKSS